MAKFFHLFLFLIHSIKTHDVFQLNELSESEKSNLTTVNIKSEEIGPLLTRELDYALDNVNRVQQKFSEMDTAIIVKGAFLLCVEESDFEKILKTISTITLDYPLIFLHDKPLSLSFKESIRAISRSEVVFGFKGPDVSRYIPKTFFEDAVQKTKTEKRNYNAMDTFMHMSRLYAGLFANNSIFDHFDYIWRVEPGSKFICDLNYDPFVYMKLSGKKYGFNFFGIETMAMNVDFWKVKEIKDKFYDLPEQLNHGLHLWNSFEIIDLEIYRRQEYMDYVHFMKEISKHNVRNLVFNYIELLFRLVK